MKTVGSIGTVSMCMGLGDHGKLNHSTISYWAA